MNVWTSAVLSCKLETSFSTLQMLYFNRIEVSEAIDINKTCESKKYNISEFWYFLYESLKF